MSLRIQGDACIYTSTLKYSACVKRQRTLAISDISCRYVFLKSSLKRINLLYFFLSSYNEFAIIEALQIQFLINLANK